MTNTSRNPDFIRVPELTFGDWNVWFVQRELVKATLLKHLPVLDGIYLLDGQVEPYYFGISGHICRRLRNHNKPWESAVCITLGSNHLTENSRKYLEYAVGLMLLLTGVSTRNQRLDYPEPDPSSSRFARSFLRNAFVPLWTGFGTEIGLPNRKYQAVARQVANLLRFE